MAGEFWERLKRIAVIASALRDAGRTASQKYQTIGGLIMGRTVSGNQLLADRERLVNAITQTQLGKMCAFYYDPKLKKKLPYYDRFPLIIPLEIYPDGFLGLNLHYLPPRHRAALLDILFITIYKDRAISDKKRIQITYQLVKHVSQTRFYVPTIKRYLNSHVRSRFYMVPVDDWDLAIFLPVDRFEKENRKKVWQDSLRKIRGGNP